MSTDAVDRPLVILGCGYIGSRLARAALAQGRRVVACARNLTRLAPLAEAGAELLAFDATKNKVFGPILNRIPGASVVYALPQIPGVVAGESVRRASQAALDNGARAFIYLGSSGLYGKRPDDSQVIDETTALAHDDSTMTAYLKDESALQAITMSGLRTVVLRPAAVYGVGRGVRMRLRKGDYQLIDDGAHWISRIHVDDLVRIIQACDDRAAAGAVYMIADDRPTSQLEYTEWLCARLGTPLPPSVPTFSPTGGPSTAMRARNLCNALVKRELGLELLYPTYLEGEAQIEAEEAAAAAAAAAQS